VQSDTEIVTLIATLATTGWLVMFVTQAIKRPSWPSWVKLLLAFVVSGIFGVASAWMSGSVLDITAHWGSLTAADVLAFGAVVYAAAATCYHIYFGDTSWMKGLAAWPWKAPTKTKT